MSTYSNAADLDFFNECLDNLTVELVKDDLDIKTHGHKLDDFDGDSVGTVDEEEMKKSAWVASLLASSEEDEHRRKALAFGVLSYTKHENDEKENIYRRYLYIILSRLGNLPAFDNVDPTETGATFEKQLVKSLDSVLGTELITTRQEYKVNLGPTLSRFQRDIYNYLLEGRDVAISGPTSSGKSFILRKYIEKRIETDEDFEAIYVVPTRALISEVSRELSKIEGITVQNGAYFEEAEVEEDEENVFLVVTPERCRKLIDPEVRGKISPSLVFFDEVQNVEDDTRGVLFEGIVKSLNEFYPSAQIVAAGPYLENPGNTLRKLTNKEVEEVQSAFTPVLQLRVSLQFKRGRNQEISAKIHSPSGETMRVNVPEPSDLSFSKVDNNKTKSLPSILSEFASNSKTLVYSGQKNYAESRANLIAENNEEQTLSPELEELKQFLSRNIHDEYSLIDCLERGVAFHHGSVPKVAREAIENIYSNTGDLHTIVTTPTLLQGVNLPAEKIFLVGAKRGNQDLTDFEFNNLIGRVGRIDTKLYGGIYCVETEEDEWADEKLENAEEKEVEPATSQAIGEADKLIEALNTRDLTSVGDSAIRYTAILLRGRYLKEDKNVEEYLESKDMDPQKRGEIHTALADSLGDVNVPKEILRKNPTLDPINLSELYNSVKSDSNKWVLGEGQFDDIYSDLLEIAASLNEIFKFTHDESGIKPDHIETECPALKPIIVYASKWLQGNSYQDMIQNRQEYVQKKDREETIDESIREVMKIVDRDICFSLVKYFGVLTTILEDVAEDTPNWILQFDKMLEMGSMNVAELKLMSEGVDRSVAVDLGIPLGVENPVEYLQENRGQVPSFYDRHLENQGIL